MSKKSFEVIGLDADFNVISLLRYTNLQWRRKYYESGSFSVQIPVDQYNPSIKYIYTKDRKEVGEISQINYISSNGEEIMALSGYFLEDELNRMICYPNGVTNVTGSPEWALISDNAETVAYTFFDAFSSISYTVGGTTIVSDLGIETSDTQGRGKLAEHSRTGAVLGGKIYEILKPSAMSYRVAYDFENNKKKFVVWSGLDRRLVNTDGNNPVVFSTRFGNLRNPNILISDTEYKNCFIVKNDKSQTVINVEAGCERATDDDSDRYAYVEPSISAEDYATDAEYINALHVAGHEELLRNNKTASFDFEATEGSYEYLQDFDLGDICDLVVNELNLSISAVLIGCEEVIKAGEWKLRIEFDI